METRWKALLKKRTFWTGLAMALVPVLNALTGRLLDQAEMTMVLVGLGAIVVKLLYDDVLSPKCVEAPEVSDGD